MTYKDLPENLKDVYRGLDQKAKQAELWWDGKTLRFKANKAISEAMSRLDLNDFWKCDIPRQDMQEFYRLAGYSVCGYTEIFDQ